MSKIVLTAAEAVGGRIVGWADDCESAQGRRVGPMSLPVA